MFLTGNEEKGSSRIYCNCKQERLAIPNKGNKSFVKSVFDDKRTKKCIEVRNR